ncbi:MAG: cyclic nucleotide-binding domain-containing protein [Firmicutes bacterium]|nr:cyclic nucleotide-binding domain-containing protein [Bacillota bacterium]
MARPVIDDAYLSSFFDLGNDEEGRAECASIRASLERLEFGNGEDICTIDGEPDGMFFLESGSCAVIARDGQQVNVMREGQYFGEYGVLSGQKRLTTVRSLGRSVVYKLGSEDMMAILGRHPSLYGELMRQVYGQVSKKHAQLLTLSQIRRGILRTPDDQVPLSLRRMVLQYGGLALLFILVTVLVPKGAGGPVFLIPLALMVAYALLTKRTLGSLAVSGMLAAVLLFRSGLAASYTDALMETMGDPGNVFTVLVMALMGAVITLIEASGAVTAFQKIANNKVHTKRGVALTAVGVMAVTAIDDCLNMLTAATTVRKVADEQRVPRERTAMLLSFLPTVLCSFIPFSLWGIFVIANIDPSLKASGAVEFFRAIPFNFFPIVALIAMLLLCFGKLPLARALKDADSRVEAGEKLWPAGSEEYLPDDETKIWGHPRNLILPVVVLAITCITARTVWTKSLILDSACGLVATLIFLFFLYCGQRLMSPSQFADHMVSGVQSMTLPILLYLMAMCLSALLKQESLDGAFESALRVLGPVSWLIPAMLFLAFTLLTVTLGSSWAMYVIGFPIAIKLALMGELSVPLCIGAVCAAGIAGEKNCVYTSDALSVGSAIGCEPGAISKLRLRYSLIFTAISFAMYLIAGLIF